MTKIPALIPPRGLGYEMDCGCCFGIYLPGDEGHPPMLGGRLQDRFGVVVATVWSIL